MEPAKGRARKLRMGDILVELGVITPDQLQVALKQTNPEQRRLGALLVALGFATEEDIDKAVSSRLGIPYFTSFEGMLDPEVAVLIPEALARKLLVEPRANPTARPPYVRKPAGSRRKGWPRWS